MASEEGILIKIGAQVDDAVKGAEKVSASVLKMGDSGKKAVDALNASLDKMEAAFNAKWNPVVEKAEKSISSLQKQVTAFGGGVTNFKVSEYFKKIGEDANKSFGEVTKASQNARYAVLDIGHIFRDLPYAISNPAILAGPFDRATQALTTLKQESTATGQSFGQLVSAALMGPGGLLIAVEIVTSALIIFGPALVRAFSGADEVAEKINRLAEHHRNLISTMEAAAKSAGGEVFNLRVLEKAATDVTKPMSVRIEAVKELQKEYPNYLGNLSKEAILNGQAASQINLVADALYKKAFAEAASNKAADTAGKQLDLKLRENFLIQEQQKAQKEFNDALVEHNKLLAATPLNQQPFIVDSGLAQANEHLSSINNFLVKNREQQAFNNKEIGFYTDQAAKAYDATSKLTVEKEKHVKHVKTEAEIQAELERTMTKIGIEEASLGKNLDPERISAIETAIKELLDIKVSATSETIKNLSDRLTELGQKTYTVKGLSTEKEVSKPLNPFPETFDTKFADPSGGALHILDQIVQKQKEAKKASDEYNNSIDSLGKSLVGTFENVFTELISGGGNALKIFAQYIQTVIMKLIAAAAVAALLTAITGGVFGGAAVAGGTNFMSRFSAFSGIPFHAAGGITTGPHLAMVGDNPSGREAIIPFERMGEFVNNFTGGDGGTLETRISGDDLVVLLNRANTRRGRLYGG